MIAWVWLRWTSAGVVIRNAPNMTGERVRGEQAAQRRVIGSIVAGRWASALVIKVGRPRSHRGSHRARGGRQPPWDAAKSAMDHAGRSGGEVATVLRPKRSGRSGPVGDPGRDLQDKQKTSGGHPMVVWHLADVTLNPSVNALPGGGTL